MAAYDRLLADNIAAVRGRIAEAAEGSGRQASDVTLVAVTKYVDVDVTRSLFEAGCETLGESRPQAVWQKAELMHDLPVVWHMIGHLQRNKIRRTLPYLECVHSADSTRVLDALQQEALRLQRKVQVLLELNISRDDAKTGLLPEAALPLVPQLKQWDALDICGLMAMSGRSSDADTVRREFSEVRMLRDRMQLECPPEISLRHLSMGMSGDYALAVEEGATLVRVGSALFEGIDR